MDQKVISVNRYLHIDGIRTSVREYGSGSPLMLVHGLGGSLMWQRVIPLLGDEFRIISPDLPGFGMSANPVKRFRTTDYALFLGHLLDECGIDRTSLCGVSYGGQIALTFASMFPERVCSVVLVSSTGNQPARRIVTNSISWCLLRLVVKHLILGNGWLTCRIARRSFADISSRPPDLCSGFHEQIMQEGKRDCWLVCFRSVFSEGDSPDLHSGLDKPVMIAWGNMDRTIPLRFGENFHRAIPGSEFTVFPHCAHSLPLECPRELAGAVKEFLKSNVHRKGAI